DFVTQVTNVHINNVGRVNVIRFVQVVPDHGTGHHPSLVRGQELKQGELAGGKPDRMPLAFHGPGAAVNLQVVNAQDRILHLVTAGQGAEPGEQLLVLNRHGEVAVGAKVKTADAIGKLAAEQEEDDVGGDARPAPVLHVRKGGLGGQQRQDENIVIGAASLGVGFVGISGYFDNVTLVCEKRSKSFSERVVVGNQKNSHVKPSFRRD